MNTTTVGPDEAEALDALVATTGAAYLHAPVMGSTPAVAAGRLTILAGGKPSAEVDEVLGLLGETLVFAGPAEAAGLKLVANGVLGDSLASLRRALARGDALGLPRDAVLDVVGRSVLGRFVDGRRDVLDAAAARPEATFAAGALAKDLALLASATDTVSDARAAVGHADRRGRARGRRRHQRGRRRRPGPRLAGATLGSTSRPRSSPTPDVLRPLHAYALTHATGDPAYLDDAFLPTARVDGYRDGELVSWTLDEFRGVFAGSPASDETARSRRVERLDVRGSAATRRDDAAPRRRRLHRRVRAPTGSGVGSVADREQGVRATGRRAMSTPTTSTAPPSSSAGVGTSSRRSQAEAIATTGASSTQGTTEDDGLRLSSVLKMP